MAKQGFTTDTAVVVGLQFRADNASLTKSANQVANSLGQLQKKTAMTASKMSSYLPAFAAIGAASYAAFNTAIRGAIGFQDAFTGVRKTLDFTGGAAKNSEQNFQALAKNLINISTQAPIAATELAKIGEIGGQLGIQAVNIGKFTETIAKLTVATNMGAEEGAFALSRLSAITRTPERQIGNLASVVVRLGNEFAATESEIVGAAQKIAAAMELLESPTSNAAADSLALAAALKQVGLQTQSGSTAVARALDTMSKAVIGGGRELSIFAKVSEMTSEGFAQLAEQSPAQAFVAFLEGLKKVGNAGANTVQLLEELGLSQQRTLRALRSMALASDSVKDALSSANEEFVLNNALQSEAEKRYATITSQVGILRNTIQALAIEVGNDALPVVEKLIKGMQNIAGGTTKKDLQGMAKFITAMITAFFFLRTAIQSVNESLQEMIKLGVQGTGEDGAIRLGADTMKSGKQIRSEISGLIRDNFTGKMGSGEGAFKAAVARKGGRVDEIQNIFENIKPVLGESLLKQPEENKRVLQASREDDGTFNRNKLESELDKQRFDALMAIIEALRKQFQIEEANVTDARKVKILNENRAKLTEKQEKLAKLEGRFASDKLIDKSNVAEIVQGNMKKVSDEETSLANLYDAIETKKITEDLDEIMSDFVTSYFKEFKGQQKSVKQGKGPDEFAEIIAGLFDEVNDLATSAVKAAEAASVIDTTDFNKNLDLSKTFDELFKLGFKLPIKQGEKDLAGKVAKFFKDLEKDPKSPINITNFIRGELRQKGSSYEKSLKKFNEGAKPEDQLDIEEFKKAEKLGKKLIDIQNSFNAKIKDGNTAKKKSADAANQAELDFQNTLKNTKKEIAAINDLLTDEQINALKAIGVDLDDVNNSFENVIDTVETFNGTTISGQKKQSKEISDVKSEIRSLEQAIEDITGVKDTSNSVDELTTFLTLGNVKALKKQNAERLREIQLLKQADEANKKKTGKGFVKGYKPQFTASIKEEEAELIKSNAKLDKLLSDRFEKTGKASQFTEAFKFMFEPYMLGDQIAKLLEFLKEKMPKIIDSLKRFLAPAVKVTKAVIGPVVDFVVAGTKILGKGFQILGEGIVKFVKASIPYLEQFAKWFGEKLVNGFYRTGRVFKWVVSTVFNGAVLMAGAIVKLTTFIADKMVAGFKIAQAAVKKFIDDFPTRFPKAYAALQTFKTLITQIPGNFKAMADFIKQKATSLAKATKEVMTEVIGSIKEDFAELKDAFKEIIVPAKDYLVLTFKRGFNLLKEFGKLWIEGMKMWMVPLKDFFVNTMIGAFRILKEFGKLWIEGIKQWVIPLKDFIVSTMQGAFNLLKDFGKLWVDGIKMLFNEIAAPIKSVMSEVFASMKQDFQELGEAFREITDKMKGYVQKALDLGRAGINWVKQTAAYQAIVEGIGKASEFMSKQVQAGLERMRNAMEWLKGLPDMLSKGWGSGMDKLKKYIEELKKANAEKQKERMANLKSTESYQKVSSKVEKYRIELGKSKLGKNIQQAIKNHANLIKILRKFGNVVGGVAGLILRKRSTLVKLNRAMQMSIKYSKATKLAFAGMVSVINGVKAAVMGLMKMFWQLVVVSAIFSFFAKLTEESKKTAAAIKEVADEIVRLNEVQADLDFNQIQLDELNKALDKEMAKASPNQELIKVLEQQIKDIENAYAKGNEDVKKAKKELGRTLLFETTAVGQNVTLRINKISDFLGFDEMQRRGFVSVIEEQLGEMLYDTDLSSVDEAMSIIFENLNEIYGNNLNNFQANQLAFIQDMAKQKNLTFESYVDLFDTTVDFGMLDSMAGQVFTDSYGAALKKYSLFGISGQDMVENMGIDQFNAQILAATNIKTRDLGNGMIELYTQMEEYVIGSGRPVTKTVSLGTVAESILGSSPKEQIEFLGDFAANLVFIDTITSQMRGKGGNPIFANNVDVGNQAKVSTFMQMQNEALIKRAEFLRASNVLSQDLNFETMKRGELIKTVRDAEILLVEKQTEEAKKQLETLGLAEYEITKFQKSLNDQLAKSANGAVSIFSQLPKRIRKTVGAMIEELTIKSFQMAKFDSDVRKLASMAPMLAHDIAAQGLAAQGILNDFLKDPAAIATAEGLLQRMRPKDAVDMGLTVEEQEKLQAQGLKLGDATSEGILVGIQNRKAEIGRALVSSIENAVELAEAYEQSNSPSKLTRDVLGKPLIEGIAAGVDSMQKMFNNSMVNSVESGIDSADKALDNITDYVEEHGYFDGAMYFKKFADGITNSGDEVMDAVKTEIAEVSDFLIYGFSQAVGDIEEALNMMFAVTGGLRDITAANYAVQTAEQNLMAVRRKNATLNERILKNQIALQKAELEGRKNNITMSEEASILQKKIALEDMKKKMKGERSASDRKAIVDAEEELERVRLAAEAGIATSLDVEVAQEKLDELKGTNLSLDEQRLKILEVSLAEEDLEETKRKAREVDEELIALREEHITLLDEQANANFELQTAYDGLEAATENVYLTELKYETARQAFIDFAKDNSVFEALVEAYGGVGGAMDNVITKTINLANNTETSMARAISSVRAYITEMERAKHVASQYNALSSISIDDLNKTGVTQLLNENKEISALSADTGFAKTALGARFESDIKNRQFGGVGSDSTQSTNRELFSNTEDYMTSKSAVDRLRSRGKGDRRDFANAFQYLYGVQTTLDSTGNVIINSKQLMDAMKDPNNQLSQLGVSYEELVNQIKEATGVTIADVTGSYQSGVEDLARAQSSTRLTHDYTSSPNPMAKTYNLKSTDDLYDIMKRAGYAISGNNEAVTELVKKSTNNDLKRDITDQWTYANNYSKYSSSLFTLVKNVLDTAHQQDKLDKFDIILKRKYGGMVAPFRRALVGEYGPEMVTALPQGGLRVTPEGSGRAGITVQNLSVNVTGVPSDPIQARKAAQEIQKALVRLEKEGNYGTGLSRR